MKCKLKRIPWPYLPNSSTFLNRVCNFISNFCPFYECLSESTKNFLADLTVAFNSTKLCRTIVMDLENLEDELVAMVQQDKLYWIRNDAKFRAASQHASFDDFEKIVKVKYRLVD